MDRGPPPPKKKEETLTVTLPLPFNDTLSDSLYNGEEDLKLTTKFVMMWKEEDL